MGSTGERSAALWLACVRIGVGLVLLRGALDAWRAGDALADSIALLVAAGLDARAAPVRAFANHVLLENPSALALLWKLGLTVSGLGLTLGALVRPCAVLALVYVMHALAFGPSTEHSLHWLLLICLVACAYAGNKRLALDPALDGMLPRWLTFAPKRRRFG